MMTPTTDDAAVAKIADLRIEIDIRAPEPWRTWRYFVRHGSRIFGVVLAACPTTFAFGFEVLTGFGKGIALCIGPLWLGVVIAPVVPPAHLTSQP